MRGKNGKRNMQLYKIKLKYLYYMFKRCILLKIIIKLERRIIHHLSVTVFQNKFLNFILFGKNVMKKINAAF